MGAKVLGEEWGGAEFADLIVELVQPYLGPNVDVLELGCGGGKFSRRLAPRCRSLLCTDISSEMLKRTRSGLVAEGLDDNVGYQVLNGIDFTGVADESIDFIFSYDVQLHLQPQNVYTYMTDARRVLRDNGIFMLHQINLNSMGGLAHFLVQQRSEAWRLPFHDPRRRGLIHFMSGDQMRALADAARLAVVEIVDDFPPEGSRLRPVTSGRDLIGFFRLMPSRLRHVDPARVRLVRERDQPTVYAILDGLRVAFASSVQFAAAGFETWRIEVLSSEEIAQIPEGPPLTPWE